MSDCLTCPHDDDEHNPDGWDGRLSRCNADGCECRGAIDIHSGMRLAIEQSGSMGDWFVSHSPRNSNAYAEGQWCQWVHLARLILAHPLTAEQMPDFALPYDDAPRLYSEGHPACIACAKDPS